MANPVTWWEIQVPDLDEAAKFYGGTFGWTFSEWRPGYQAAHAPDGSMVGGLAQTAGDPAGRQIHVVFNLDERDDDGDTLEQFIDKVTAHGGKVTTPRTLIAPEMGWYATIQDPSGLAFDVWTGRAAKA